MTPRGIRNNNPGNIRHGASKWRGMSEFQKDPQFVMFDRAVYGIRALAKLLRNYQKLHGLTTVRQMINRWAPPVENDTGHYVRAVAGYMRVDPDEPIDLADTYTICVMIEAIVLHENGMQPYDRRDIYNGIDLANE